MCIYLEYQFLSYVDVNKPDSGARTLSWHKVLKANVYETGRLAYEKFAFTAFVAFTTRISRNKIL